VEFEHDAKISLLEFAELENYLSDLLGVKVDLVEKFALKLRICKRILSEVVYLWGDYRTFWKPIVQVFTFSYIDTFFCNVQNILSI